MPLPCLRIVIDRHVWGVPDAFHQFSGFTTELSIVEHQDITRKRLQSADILITRSSTRVDASLLSGTSVRFVGTATVGIDHVDTTWLADNGIAFASAAGSSTGSVLEYWTTALLELHARGLIRLPHIRLGIIGVGRIGSRVAEMARALGMDVLCSDPPRARRENGDFVPLGTLLSECDLLSLHTPLTREPPDATQHLINTDALNQFKGRGVINTARGGVIAGEALADWLDADASHMAVLDCWENEPAISRRLLAHSGMVIATPHIAGHSLDGKAANTQYVYEALCAFLGSPPTWKQMIRMPDPEPAVHDIPCNKDAWINLHRAATALYPINRDDAALKVCLDADDAGLATSFREQRRHYPIRRAWDVQGIHFTDPSPALLALARAINLKTI